MNKLRLCVLTGTLLLSACSATVANYQAELQAWVGQSAQSLESSWGAPASVIQSGAAQIYTYTQSDGAYVSGGYWRRWATPLYCSTSFTVQNGVVTGAQFVGNECRAY